MGLVRELLRRHRHPRLITKGCQCTKCRNDVAGPELDHQINVVSEPQLAVRVDRQAPGHKVANACMLKCADNGFKTGELHDPGSIALIVGRGRRPLKSFLGTFSRHAFFVARNTGAWRVLST